MQIQVHTDNHIEGREALVSHVETVVGDTLRHFRDRLTRVEIHLGDENSGKAGGHDKRCVMEARPKGHPPVAVTEHAGSVHEAINGAARKLKAVLETTLGRLHDQQLRAPPPGDAVS